MENIFWIPVESVGKLAIVTRPRPADWLQEEIRNLKRSNIEVLVSALTREETEELGLVSEPTCCKSEGIEFISFPIPDRSVPSDQSALGSLARQLATALRRGKGVGIHCRASIGRSSIIAASVLVQFGTTAESAFSLIRDARGCDVPDTPDQRAWVASNMVSGE